MDELQKKIIRDNPKLFPPKTDHDAFSIIFDPNISLADKIIGYILGILMLGGILGFMFLALLLFGNWPKN